MKSIIGGQMCQTVNWDLRKIDLISAMFRIWGASKIINYDFEASSLEKLTTEEEGDEFLTKLYLIIGIFYAFYEKPNWRPSKPNFNSDYEYLNRFFQISLINTKTNKNNSCSNNQNEIQPQTECYLIPILIP